MFATKLKKKKKGGKEYIYYIITVHMKDKFINLFSLSVSWSSQAWKNLKQYLKFNQVCLPYEFAHMVYLLVTLILAYSYCCK